MNQLAHVALFGTHHLWALCLCVLGIAWYLNAALQADRDEQIQYTGFLALLLFWSYPFTLLFRYFLDPSLHWQDLLPLHLCSLMSYVAAGALIFRCPFLRSVTYFMGVLVCLQGLLTPALVYDFPSPMFFEFFISHALIVLTALYLPIVLGWRPRKKDFLWAIGFGAGYMLLMLALNPLLGTNFGFVMGRPENSILDYMGPWPWYLFSMLALGLLMMWLIGLPLSRATREKGC